MSLFPKLSSGYSKIQINKLQESNLELKKNDLLTDQVAVQGDRKLISDTITLWSSGGLAVVARERGRVMFMPSRADLAI